ncbi:hypothetical protein NBRC116493_02790 [Aurantivibrio infirmus]
MMEISSNLDELDNSDWKAEEISLRQCMLGDSIDKIQFDTVLNTTRLDIPIKEQLEFDILPLKHKFHLLTNNEGWVQTKGGINFRVSKNQIVQFGLFQGALTPLVFKGAESISNRFGKPDDVNKFYRQDQLSETEFFYNSKQLLVVWSHVLNQLLHINIGPKYLHRST